MKTESAIAFLFHVPYKIESRARWLSEFEKAFYYFGITFYFAGFVSFLSLSWSLSLYLCLFILFLSYFLLFHYRTSAYAHSSLHSIYISLHYISQNVFLSAFQ